MTDEKAMSVAEMLAALREAHPDWSIRETTYEAPWTREDHDGLAAEQRAQDKRQGEPGSCPI